MKLNMWKMAFWTTENAPETSDDGASIIGAALVDDETIVLFSKSPERLRLVIDVSLSIFVEVFSRLQTDINWPK